MFIKQVRILVVGNAELIRLGYPPGMLLRLLSTSDANLGRAGTDAQAHQFSAASHSFAWSFLSEASV